MTSVADTLMSFDDESVEARSVPFTLAEKALLVSAVAMFVIYNCGILTVGMLPIKPRDGTLLLLGATILPLLFCRQRHCLPALAVMIIPIWRVYDALFLRRFEIKGEEGGHIVGVLQMAVPGIIAGVAILVYGTRVGRLFAIAASVGLIVVCVASDLYEWMGFAKYTIVPGRMAGFLEHPNTAPTYGIMCLTVLYTLNKRFWWNMFMSFLVAIPAVLSISRSCMMIYFATVAIYVVLNFRAHFKGLLITAAMVPPVFLAWVGAVEASASHGRIRHDEFTEGRFEAIYKFDIDGLKSAERAKDLQDGWDGVWASPAWGYGPGGSRGERWQPHNQIVALWLDLGVLGMAVYVIQLLWPLIVSAMRGFPGGYCLIPAFLNVPCQHWLVEMAPYWFVLAVAYAEIFVHRVEIRMDGD